MSTGTRTPPFLDTNQGDHLEELGGTSSHDLTGIQMEHVADHFGRSCRVLWPLYHRCRSGVRGAIVSQAIPPFADVDYVV